jgi:polyhydroxyalkanoate synthesis regulator phasin
MAQDDLLKRLLDAGMTFTAMTQARAEEVIREFVRAGEAQAQEAQSAVDELVDPGRRSSDRLVDAVRAEIREQLASLGLATTADIERLERKIDDVAAARTSGASRAVAAGKATKATKARTAKATKASKAGKGKSASRPRKAKTSASKARPAGKAAKSSKR